MVDTFPITPSVRCWHAAVARERGKYKETITLYLESLLISTLIKFLFLCILNTVFFSNNNKREEKFRVIRRQREPLGEASPENQHEFLFPCGTQSSHRKQKVGSKRVIER